MEYLIDYFIFTFFAAFGVLQIALSKKLSGRFNFGVLVLAVSYTWFFGSKDRNVASMVEGVQLFLIFGMAALLATFATKVLFNIKKKNEYLRNR
jgi:hypothetical protein